MPLDIKGATAEELRLRNYRNQLQQKNDMELREIEAQHADSIVRTMESATSQIENLRQAYDVQISREAEQLEDRLFNVRASNEERVQAEKKAGDEQLHKLKTAQKQRIDEYKKNADAQLEALRKQLQASEENLREKSKKAAAKRERETTV